eukprot:TRINITY_DN74258_c0_g1_i1.p1 TRINITY_DN74258_c0_g1~~TRINITY_DN74258_c0_g1_i1.p1  ORF type:complete len:451 (-),score=64.53 TRINITY_DN74258_c0_g1_i1:107-1459(-)
MSRDKSMAIGHDEGKHEDDKSNGVFEHGVGPHGLGVFDSTFELEPVQNFLTVNRWQRELENIQLRAAALTGTAAKATARTLGDLRQRQHVMAKQLADGKSRVVGSIREQQKLIQQKYSHSVDGFIEQLDPILAKARYARIRQLRHMVCFCCAMVDVVVTSYWLGASPLTFHFYYSFKEASLITFRAIWYRWHGYHYFLYDLCYYCNALLMLYIWVFPHSKFLFNAVYGFSGVLLVSVFAFRNSFVPHSLDKITSIHVHISPVIQLWLIRWYNKDMPNSPFVVPDEFSILPTLLFYTVWVVTYILHQFVFGRKRIEEKGYLTLYHLMANDMGILQLLPKRLQGPLESRVVFILGHFCLFLSGVPAMYFPYRLHSFTLCASIFYTFLNGANFYITYFWKVYENQITSFEEQLQKAQSAIQEEAKEPNQQNMQGLSVDDATSKGKHGTDEGAQ